MEYRQKKKKNQETKSRFFENINKIDNTSQTHQEKNKRGPNK